MKKTRKILLTIALASAFGATSAMLAGCGKKVDLSFNTNGASAIESVTMKIGEQFVLPSPVREGYRFDGWFDNESFNGAPVTSITVSADVTYYAKWTQVYAVNLNANGGELSTTTIYLAKGDNIYNAVKDLKPTKSGLTFGAWFNGNNELSSSATMRTSELNLTAQYKVGYTVEIYHQNLSDNEYTKVETIPASEYVGKNFTSVVAAQTGFMDVTDEATVKKVLSATASENVFKHYFDRNTYTVTFNPRFPDGSGSSTSIPAKYGEEISVPSDLSNYKIEGYCLLGWTTNPNSTDVEYPTDLSSLLYNKDSLPTETLKHRVQRTTTLYGVWQAGYTDMFGGDDYIYYLGGDNDVVYLSRGNVYFQGTYNAKKNEFSFANADNKRILLGKFCDNGKFVYADELRTGSAQLYRPDEGIVSLEQIIFDKYNGIDYIVKDEAGKIVAQSKGVYEIDGNGDYVATFQEGPLSGSTMNFVRSTALNEYDQEIPVFQARNDGEYLYGKIVLLGLGVFTEGGHYEVGSWSGMSFELDGFGTAKFTSSGQVSTYKYKTDENGNVVILDKYNKPIDTIYIMPDPNTPNGKGYMVYEETMADTFQISANEVLTLNGLYSAVLVKDGVTIEANYKHWQSAMGATIVSLIDHVTKEEHQYLFTPTTKVVGNEIVDTYDVRKVLSTYTEYYYKDAGGLYYAPMLVLDETEAGYASVYGYTAEGKFVKVSEGTYELGNDGLYLYKAKKTYRVPEALTEPIDLATIDSIVFALDTDSTGYNVNYWYSANDGDIEFFKDYQSTNLTSNESLQLVGGFAFYKANAQARAVVASYTLNGTLLYFTVDDTTYYFTVDEENKKFTTLRYAPYNAVLKETNGKYNNSCYLSFDGLGNAVYYVGSQEIPGTVVTAEENGFEKRTEFDETVWKFQPTDAAHADKAFEFIDVKVGATRCFILADATYAAGDYFTSSASKESGMLTVDGYTYWAKFISNGVTYEGTYSVDGDTIVLKAGRTFYFDFTSDVEFTVRGAEYGEYAIYENQYSNGVFVELDGYGKMSVFKFVLEVEGKDAYVRKYLATDGWYNVEDGVYLLAYGTGDKAVAYECIVNGMSFTAEDGESYSGLANAKNLTKEIFVDTSDWSVLILDRYGRATKCDKEGNKQNGTYTFVTEELLHFSSRGEGSCIYIYDEADGEATPVQLDPKSYYSSDLRSLYFAETGFAIINGNEDETYFYTYDDNDNAILYWRAKKGEQANNFGFASKNFGELNEESKEYNGEVYYRNESVLTFQRGSVNADQFPLIFETERYDFISVSFSPSGGEEFNVRGRASFDYTSTVKGETTTQRISEDCYVVREFIDGVPVMYVTLGSYRFYINATYSAENSSCEVTALRYVQSFDSWYYIDGFYRTYVRYGEDAAYAYQNEFGTITMEREIGRDGAILSSTANVEFDEKSGFFDLEGNVLGHKQAIYKDGKDGMMIAEFEALDGFTYRVYFKVARYPYVNAYGYYVFALVRVQDVEVGEYVVSIGRTVASEDDPEIVGDVYSVEITKNGQALQGEEFFYANGKLSYVVRERDVDDYVTKATYYTISLVENEDGSLEDETVPTYQSATVSVAEATILCELDPTDPDANYKGKDRYVEIVDGEIKALFLVRNKRYAKTCSYDETTGVYTVDTTDGRTYYVKVAGDNVTITEKGEL